MRPAGTLVKSRADLRLPVIGGKGKTRHPGQQRYEH
jgi:hypothetical protein